MSSSMSAIRFLLIAFVCAGSSALCVARQPNVLFLLTDDQRADAIGAFGNPYIITPNLDALAGRGVAFWNAYCMGGNNAAVCTPSRNMLLSGRAYFRFKRFAEADKPNVPKSFRNAGYETWHLGKRGNTADEIHKVFEHSAYLDDEKARTCGEPGKETVETAIDFLDHRDSARPFLMWIEFAVPHDPRVASADLMNRYDREKIPLPPNFMPLHPFDNGEMEVRDERLAPWPRTEAEIRRHLHDYYAVITGLDREIGKLIEQLRAKGEIENTVIVFTSDNGLALGSHGLMGKQNLYDHSMKVPLIVAGPGIRAGNSEALVYLLDLFPTLCDLAGLAIPNGLDGISLKPVIDGKAERVRESLFLAYRDVQRAIRDERFKLIRYPQINRTQLFDLTDDPNEMRDISGVNGQAERIARMTGLMTDWQRKLGDTQALSVSDPRSGAWTPPGRE